MTSPRVTVLMPVYNGQAFLREAVASVLAQTYHDFELLIIDDGSTDKTPAILQEFHDPRIRIVRNETNLKLIRSLNRGIGLARGEFIARMDADDLCHPERFARQVEFLERSPDVDVVGTDIIIFETDTARGFRPSPPPTSAAQVRWELLRVSCLYHPTVMLRKSIFASEEPYDPEYVHCEDYELWLRLSRRRRLENLDEPLLYYRRHAASITACHRIEQRQRAQRALATEIERRIGYRPSEPCTGLLMNSREIRVMENLDEFHDVFSRLLSETLAQKNLTSQDRIFIRLSAFTTIVRMMLFAAVGRPSHLPALLRALFFDLKLDPSSAFRLPVHLARHILRRASFRERFSYFYR